MTPRRRDRGLTPRRLAAALVALQLALVAPAAAQSILWKPAPRIAVTKRLAITMFDSSSVLVPADWNSANNSIEAIGCGGFGGDGSSTVGGGGGGGGEYRKSVNVTLTPGGVLTYHIATDNTSGTNSTSLKVGATTIIQAFCGKPGALNNATPALGGTGGVSNSTHYDGGAAGPLVVVTSGGTGGGGSAGPDGPGCMGIGGALASTGGGGGGATDGGGLGSCTGQGTNDPLGGSAGGNGPPPLNTGGGNGGAPTVVGGDGLNGAGGGGGGNNAHGGGASGYLYWTGITGQPFSTFGPEGGSGAGGSAKDGGSNENFEGLGGGAGGGGKNGFGQEGAPGFILLTWTN